VLAGLTSGRAGLFRWGRRQLEGRIMGCSASSINKFETPRQREARKRQEQWTNAQLRHFSKQRVAGTQRLRALCHSKARQSPYQGGVARFSFMDKYVPWESKFNLYKDNVIEYTSPIVLKGPPWADKTDVTEVGFNQVDPVCKVDRCSNEGRYRTDVVTNRPLNPHGRTGMTGRGLLGRFGPNHAADPVITKWARDERGEFERDAKGRRYLQFVAVKRKDTGDWAIPGGMVDVGESVSLTLKREFGEETMSSLEMSTSERVQLEKQINKAFKSGVPVYSGYVDDIRNTDNAWMETTCVNFHDENGRSFSKFKLKAGDDAGDVAWTKYYKGMPLYATHTNFLEIVSKMHGVDYDDDDDDDADDDDPSVSDVDTLVED